MPPWLPVLLSAAIGLVTLGANVALVAFFLGKLKADQAGQERLFAQYQKSQEDLLDAFKTYMNTTIEGLQRRLQTFEEFTIHSQTDAATLNVRLGGVEKNTSGLQELREDLIRLAGRYEAHTARTDGQFERIERDVHSVQRQIANLAAHGAGRVIELPSTTGAPPPGE